jgi:hypothetical protein
MLTTELPVAFQFHLPYFTKDGSATSFIVATGPHVSVNTVLGLQLITTTGMILDFNDNVVQAKNLDCPPSPIDLCHTTKTIPAIKDDKDPKTHYIEFKEVQQILPEDQCLHRRGVRTHSVGPSLNGPPIVRYCSG